MEITSYHYYMEECIKVHFFKHFKLSLFILCVRDDKY